MAQNLTYVGVIALSDTQAHASARARGRCCGSHHTPSRRAVLFREKVGQPPSLSCYLAFGSLSQNTQPDHFYKR